MEKRNVNITLKYSTALKRLTNEKKEERESGVGR